MYADTMHIQPAFDPLMSLLAETPVCGVVHTLINQRITQSYKSFLSKRVFLSFFVSFTNSKKVLNE